MSMTVVTGDREFMLRRIIEGAAALDVLDGLEDERRFRIAQQILTRAYTNIAEALRELEMTDRAEPPDYATVKRYGVWLADVAALIEQAPFDPAIPG